MKPWWTPLTTGLNDDSACPTRTRVHLLLINEEIHLRILLEIPNEFSLWINLGTETQSKALKKSTYSIRASLALSVIDDQSFRHSSKLVQVDLFLRKPCCDGEIKWLECKKANKLDNITDSKILQYEFANKIGL